MRGISMLYALLMAKLWTIEAQVLQPNTTCKILTFIPFTDRRDPPPRDPSKPESVPTYGYGTWSDPMTQAKAAFSMMAAAELARYHFNTRDTTIVPELGDLDQCNITMPDRGENEVKYIDSGYDKISTVREFHDTRYILDQMNGTNNGGGVVENLLNGRPNQNTTGLPENDKQFCAFIGPVHPYVVDGIASFAESGRIPIIAYETTSSKFSSQREYPFFASTIPNAHDFGEIVSKAFRDVWMREGVGILYDKEDFSDFGVQLESPLRDFIDTFDHETIFAHIYQFDEDSYRVALTKVKSKGFRTIVLLNDRPGSIENIAKVADSMNMIGPGYFWLLMGAAFRPSLIRTMKYTVDSSMDKLLRGAALFTNYDRSTYMHPSNDPFLTAWKTQKVLSIDQLNRLQPFEKNNSKPLYTASASYFQDELPSEYASFIYDAVILAGISVCRDYKQHLGNGSFTHIVELRKTEFTGASGRVRFGPKDYVVENDVTRKTINQLISQFKNKSSRDPQDTIFGIYNIQRGEVDDNNMQSYEQVLTHVYSYDNVHITLNMMTEKGAWAPVPDAPFLFYDGTPNEPLPRRDVYDANYLSQGVQIAGLILASVAFIGVVGTGLWVFANRQNKLIKAGQPEFLYLLCFGAALVAPSSIFMSFDESDGLTTEQLSGLCSAFPWFFIVGYLLMYCALICKLWRLSKLMQMRRKAVHAKQVLFPILLIMGCCFVILIVWQIIDPATWVREGISGKGLPYETYGECTSVKYGIMPFVVPIVLLMTIAVSATAIFSFKLRHVQSELSESSWIFAGIFLHIQTWLVGVPVLLITHEISSDAFYVMIMILTFTFATSLVGFVIGPKMYDILKDKYFGGKRAKSQISIGGGIARVSGISNQSLSFPTTNESSPSIGSNHGSSIKLSQSEHELLRLKNIELTMELESLNVYIAELEEAARRNNLSMGCHNHGAVQPFAYDEGTEEKLMNDQPEKSPNDTKNSI